MRGVIGAAFCVPCQFGPFFDTLSEIDIVIPRTIPLLQYFGPMIFGTLFLTLLVASAEIPDGRAQVNAVALGTAVAACEAAGHWEIALQLLSDT